MISGCATKSAGQCLTAELIRFVGRRGHLDQAVLLHGAVDAASRVALEAAHDLRFRKSFSSPTSDVGTCGWIPAHADEQDAPEGVVSLAVAAPVQSVSLSSSRRCRQRRWTPGGRRHASSRRSCGAPRRANPLRASRRLPRSRPLSAPAMAPSAGRRRGGGPVAATRFVRGSQRVLRTSRPTRHVPLSGLEVGEGTASTNSEPFCQIRSCTVASARASFSCSHSWRSRRSVCDCPPSGPGSERSIPALPASTNRSRQLPTVAEDTPCRRAASASPTAVLRDQYSSADPNT